MFSKSSKVSLLGAQRITTAGLSAAQAPSALLRMLSA